MTPKVLVRPASKGSSIVSHDAIPPQPLDVPDEAPSSPSQSHDQQPTIEYPPASPATIRSNHQRSKREAVNFHKLPAKAISRSVTAIVLDHQHLHLP